MEGFYKIANHYIKIISLNKEIHDLCREYRVTDRNFEIEIIISQSDIDFERQKSEAEDKKQGIPTRHFGDGYLETLAVYRKLADCMTDFDTILFHGSVIAVDGIAYMFTAKSGTGKSTHTRLWREMFRQRAVMINDDKPLIHVSKNGATVFGTPWDGKHHLSTNTCVPLKSVCILQRGEENRICEITKDEAYIMLIQQVYKPSEACRFKKTLELIDSLAHNVKLYRLQCNMQPEAAAVAYAGMTDNKGT